MDTALPAIADDHGDHGDNSDAGTKRRANRIAPAFAPSDAGTPNPDPHAGERGPYYEHDPWNGYLWIAKTGKGTTLTASQSFQDKVFGEAVCIKGSVAASPDSSGNAMLGMNVRQAERTDAAPLALTPSLEGVQVEVTNKAGSALRVQIAAHDGTTNVDARWCAAVHSSGGFIPWTAFNTACWDGSGKSYKNEPISVAMLLVPGRAETAVSYDFCLQRLAESDAPTPGLGAGSAPPEDD